jgi:hypothetical protein
MMVAVATTAGVEAAISALTGTPVTLDVAKPLLPKSGGIYAWWLANKKLAGVPENQHPAVPELDLLYVGIAPSGSTSAATLSSRVVGNHMRGNIAASTLRRTLAALLLEQLGLTPIKTTTKVTLPREQNIELSKWQQEHLRLTWHAVAAPWTLEAAVIAAMCPPLNLADNATHPFHATLSEARRKLQAAAR